MFNSQQNRQRVEQLSNRLSTIQKGLAEDRSNKYKAFADDLESLSARINDMQKSGAEQLEDKRAEIEELSDLFEEVKAEREKFENEATERCTILDDNLRSVMDEQMEVCFFRFFPFYIKDFFKAASEALDAASKLAQEQLANCKTEVQKLLAERNSRMSADYAELAQKIPLLLKQVETQRNDEDDFLNEMQEKLKKQIEDMKRAIAQEIEV